ncbi:MAG TPA: alcohol dehydrogenase catalytic domain-containing protein [Ktedonobacteraceae bacterium]|nr:alcohol dehydrogenase catalytic domain-containing protein [Ktedonobacteraceae bacterium]
MQALVYRQHALTLENTYPIPDPPDGEALIRVSQIGICNTDIEITRGYMDFEGVLGHEFVGVVEKIAHQPGASTPKALIGKRVVGEINAACRKSSCFYCQNGMHTHCPDRTTLGIGQRDGAFAEYLTLPLENLHLVPDEVSDDEAVFVEPLAANFEIMEQVHLKPTDRVIVLGDGKMGQLAARVLALSGSEVTIVGKHPDKLLLVEHLGISVCLLDDVEELIQYGRRRVDVVVECTGSEQGLELALRLVRPRGTLVLKSTVAARSNLHLAPIVIDEIRVQGSRCGPFPPALRALAQHQIDIRPLISGRYSLDNVLIAFDYATQPGVLKVLVHT